MCVLNFGGGVGQELLLGGVAIEDYQVGYLAEFF